MDVPEEREEWRAPLLTLELPFDVVLLWLINVINML
jgi:hypothetical protein